METVRDAEKLTVLHEAMAVKGRWAPQLVAQHKPCPEGPELVALGAQWEAVEMRMQ